MSAPEQNMSAFRAHITSTIAHAEDGVSPLVQASELSLDGEIQDLSEKAANSLLDAQHYLEQLNNHIEEEYSGNG